MSRRIGWTAVFTLGLGCMAVLTGAADCAPREIWVAMRSDGQPGTGSIAEPFDGSSPAKLNALFAQFKASCGDGLALHFGPGLFLADRPWPVNGNWQIHGAGREITTLKTQDNPEGTATVGFYARCPPEHPWVSGFVLTDMTVDFNVPNLRKANRTFVFFPAPRAPHVYYAYASNPPAWSPSAAYARGAMVSRAGAEYIAIQPNRNHQPAQDLHWSVLRPNRSERLPAWDAARAYVLGDAATLAGHPYLCAAACTNAAPAAGADGWMTVNHRAMDYREGIGTVTFKGMSPGMIFRYNVVADSTAGLWNDGVWHMFLLHPPVILHYSSRDLLYLERNCRYRVADAPSGPFRRPPVRNT